MRQPIHAISAAPSRWTTERIVGFGFVGLLHVIAIYALVTGLTQKIAKYIPHEFTVDFTHQPDKPAHPVVRPQLPPVDLKTTDDTVPPPDIVIDTRTSVPFNFKPRTATSEADTSAQGIVSTHSTPPYPPIARRLGEQGKVVLRLTISPQGAVVSADVVQSSGFADLDQSAVSWVLAHWRYKPAIRNGSPVQSQTDAAVVFNLRNAG